MVRVIVLAIALLFPAIVQAQQPSVDPRLAAQMVQALQSMVSLREAQMKALQEDLEKKIADIEAKCGEPCKTPPKPQAESKQ